MTDIYLTGESKKRKGGRWWAALLLVIGLSGLGSYAYLRLEARNAAREQAPRRYRAGRKPGLRMVALATSPPRGGSNLSGGFLCQRGRPLLRRRLPAVLSLPISVVLLCACARRRINNFFEIIWNGGGEEEEINPSI